MVKSFLALTGSVKMSVPCVLLQLLAEGAEGVQLGARVFQCAPTERTQDAWNAPFTQCPANVTAVQLALLLAVAPLAGVKAGPAVGADVVVG